MEEDIGYFFRSEPAYEEDNQDDSNEKDNEDDSEGIEQVSYDEFSSSSYYFNILMESFCVDISDLFILGHKILGGIIYNYYLDHINKTKFRHFVRCVDVTCSVCYR